MDLAWTEAGWRFCLVRTSTEGRPLGPDHAPMAALRNLKERAAIHAGATEIRYNVLGKAFLGL